MTEELSEQPSSSKRRSTIFWAVLFVLIFASNILSRYPALTNADLYMTVDGAFTANNLLDTLDGKVPFKFYYEINRYVGALVDFSAVPFIWIFGPTALAFCLPVILFYSLYSWSLCLLIHAIRPGPAWTAIYLLAFAPSIILQEIGLLYLPHVCAGFLANLSFLILMRLNRSNENRGRWAFGLGAVSGLAIYIYTYSALFIASLAIILALTHPDWPAWRSKISFSTLRSLFTNLPSRREKLVRGLDVLIALFCAAVIFSYTIGGFGLDVAGVSILQINDLHKALLQFSVLLILRIFIYRKDLKGVVVCLLASANTLTPASRKLVLAGFGGFLLGLSPRLASILTGETKRGGQGFDMDFMPLQLLEHFWHLVTATVPQLLGVFHPLKDFLTRPLVDPLETLNFALATVVVLLIAISAWKYFTEQGPLLKAVIRMRLVLFTPHMFFIIFPIVICAANIVTQNGPTPRYLFPLFGIFIFWIALYLDKIRARSVLAYVALLAAWGWLSFTNNYQAYAQREVIQDGLIIKRKDPIYEAIDFCREKNIPLIYASSGLAARLRFFSGREIHGADFSRTSMRKVRKVQAAKIPIFAIVILRDALIQNTIETYIKENRIGYNIMPLEYFTIYWGFKGDALSIDGLRSLTP
jgi:hypothetical protein